MPVTVYEERNNFKGIHFLKCNYYKLFVDLKKAYTSVHLERLYNIIDEFWIPKMLVQLQ